MRKHFNSSQWKALYNWIRQLSDDYFGIDLRTLAVVRIVAGITVLWTLAILYGDIIEFFTDSGVYTREYWLETRTNPFIVSFHVIRGELWWQTLLFAVQAIFAVMLVVGYKTRFASFMTWLLLVSLFHRTPSIVHRGDTLLCLVVLWGMLTPWGARFSVDSLANSIKTIPVRVTSFATSGLLLQMPLLYFFSVILKSENGSWHTDFSAVFYSLSPEYVTAFGQLLAAYQPFVATQALTIFTIIVEGLAPILMFFPLLVFVNSDVRQRWLSRFRIVGILSLSLLQAGLLATVAVGLFPLISTLAILSAIPTSSWERAASWLDSYVRRQPHGAVYSVNALSSAVNTSLENLKAKLEPRRITITAGVIVNTVAAVLLGNIIIDNIDSATDKRILPREVRQIQRGMRIQQNWRMFVTPFRWSSHYVIHATLRNGTEVDLFGELGKISANSARELTWKQPVPQRSYAIYNNYRWRLYFQEIRGRSKKEDRRYYARYICRTWNKLNDYDEQVVRLRFYRMVQTRDLLHEPFYEESEKRLLWRHWCFGRPKT